MNWFKYFLMRALQILLSVPAMVVMLFLIVTQAVLAIPLYLLFGSSAFKFDRHGDMKWWGESFLDSLDRLYGRTWP